jgi:hypothetical protein
MKVYMHGDLTHLGMLFGFPDHPVCRSVGRGPIGWWDFRAVELEANDWDLLPFLLEWPVEDLFESYPTPERARQGWIGDA